MSPRSMNTRANAEPDAQREKVLKAYVECVVATVQQVTVSQYPVIAHLTDKGAYVLPLHERTKVIL